MTALPPGASPGGIWFLLRTPTRTTDDQDGTLIRKQNVRHAPSALVLCLQEPLVYVNNNGVGHYCNGDIVPREILQTYSVSPLHEDLIPVLLPTATTSNDDKADVCDNHAPPTERPPGTLANGTWHVQTFLATDQKSNEQQQRWVYREVDSIPNAPGCGRERFNTQDSLVIYPPRTSLDPQPPPVLASTNNDKNKPNDEVVPPPPPGSLAGGAWYIQHLRTGGTRWVYEEPNHNNTVGTRRPPRLVTQEGTEICPPRYALELVVGGAEEKEVVDLDNLPKGLVKGPPGTIPAGKWFQQRYNGVTSRDVANFLPLFGAVCLPMSCHRVGNSTHVSSTLSPKSMEGVRCTLTALEDASTRQEMISSRYHTIWLPWGTHSSPLRRFFYCNQNEQAVLILDTRRVSRWRKKPRRTLELKSWLANFVGRRDILHNVRYDRRTRMGCPA